MKSEKKKMKKGWKIFLIVLVILILVIVAGALIFSNYTGQLVAEGILHQNDGNDTKSNSIRQLELWGYDLAGFCETYEETALTFEAEDGNVVPAVILTTATTTSENKVAVLVHGAGGDHVSSYPVAEIYLENGYQVLAIDQRASGDSTNEWVSFGYFESLDVKAAVDYARNEMAADQVIVHGQSMGGLTTAVYASTDHAANNVDAFILDSSINGMEYVFSGMMMDDGLDETSTAYVVACGDWYLRHHYGFGFDDVDAVKCLSTDRVPTLLIYAQEDDLVTEEQMEAMLNAIATDQKEMITFPCGHIESIIMYKEECSDAIMSFINS